MLSSTNDILNRLNVTKTLYSKFDKDAEETLSEALIEDALRDVYQRGDRVMMGFVAIHFLLGLLFAVFSNTWSIALTVGMVISAIFYGAVIFSPRSFFTRSLSGVALQAFVILYIHQLGGIPEVRFFFFTNFTILIVYQDWRALWPSAFLLFGQIFAFAFLDQYIDSYQIISSGYRELITNLVAITPLSLGFYIGISSLQVALSGLWAHFLKRQTIEEVYTKQAILTKQLQIEQSNEKLEENVRIKTQELQEALEASQANEEELRQNMEELQATQDEMANQKQKLIENHEQMEQVGQELRERQKTMESSQWLESNLTRFDDIMRLNYDKSLEEFTDIIMLNLAELLKATQGAFYIYNDEELLLQMYGGYACTPQTVKKPQFKIGEGILGQIIKTRKPVYISDLPSDGPVIESALTKVKSKSLVILPLLYNEEIQGVLEIAVLDELPDLHREFLERLGKNIASMLQSIRGILRTQKLLSQSQEMTSKLQGYAKELEKTKQVAEEKAQEFMSQFNAIDRSMLVMEMTPAGDILNVNDNFLEISQYTQDELIGMHHSIFLSERFIQSREYQNIWNRIQKNEFVESEYECVGKENNSFWIKAHYYSLGHGKNQKIRVLAYDTTIEKQQDQKIIENLQLMQEKEEILKKNLDLMRDLQEELNEKANELEQRMNAINASTAMLEYDGEGKILFVNDKFLKILDYQREQLIGQPHTILLEHKFAESDSYANLKKRLRKQEFVEEEFEFVNSKDEIVWLRGSYYPMCDAQGNLIKVMQLASDISNEINQEEQIRDYLMALEKTKTELTDTISELEEKFAILEPYIGVLEINPEGKIIRANEPFQNQMQWIDKELDGLDYQELIPEEILNSPEYASFWDKLNKNEVVDAAFLPKGKTKRSSKMKGRYYPVCPKGSKMSKIIAIFPDIKNLSNGSN